MAWRVEQKTTKGWRFVGVIETNLEFATTFWRDLGRKWGRTYRLTEVE